MASTDVEADRGRTLLLAPQGLGLLPLIEAAVAEPPMEGMTLGPTLTDAVVIELLNERLSWNATQRWKDCINWWRYRLRARKAASAPRSLPPGRVLVTLAQQFATAQ